MKVAMVHARRLLAYLWFGVAGLMFLFLLGITLIGRHTQDEVTSLWGFMLPSIVPVLSLMIAVFFVEPAADASKRLAERFQVGLATGLSAFYLLALAMTLWWLVTSVDQIDAATAIPNLFLGPLQGLVNAALAYFFVKPKPGP